MTVRVRLTTSYSRMTFQNENDFERKPIIKYYP